MPNTFILDGSPRKNGETTVLIDAVRHSLKGSVHIFSPYTQNFRPCIDCRWCRTHEGCTIDDDMQALYRVIEGDDNVIIASPIYFGSLTPPLLAIQSRFQSYFSGSFDTLPRHGLPKKGALLLTGGGAGGYEQAEQTAKNMLKIMNAEWVGTAGSYHTDTLPAREDERALAKCSEIVTILNS